MNLALPRKYLALILATACLFWLYGLINSPIFKPAKQVVSHVQSPPTQKHLVALGYWLRYPDVAADRYWGKNGILGDKGPVEHFRRFGKNEGRILAPVLQPKDVELEKKLAESYWKRYPSVAKDPLWGRRGRLGIFGPRDHYLHRGRLRGCTWGLDAPAKPSPDGNNTAPLHRSK